MKRILVLLLVFLLVFMTSTQAFDGKRKGFVLGGGLGLAPVARWSTSGLDESSVGYGGNGLIGLGWDEQNLIVLESSDVLYKSDIFDCDLSQLFFGPTWYHYFDSREKSFFSAVGIGGYVFGLPPFYSYISIHIGPGELPPAPPSHARGLGYLIGSGYQLTRHYQIGVYLSGGKTSEHGRDFGNTHIMILLGNMDF